MTSRHHVLLPGPTASTFIIAILPTHASATKPSKDLDIVIPVRMAMPVVLNVVHPTIAPMVLPARQQRARVAHPMFAVTASVRPQQRECSCREAFRSKERHWLRTTRNPPVTAQAYRFTTTVQRHSFSPDAFNIYSGFWHLWYVSQIGMPGTHFVLCNWHQQDLGPMIDEVVAQTFKPREEILVFCSIDT